MEEVALGFWANWGAPATVDWCEANYLWTVFIAEWWNSWTSFILCLAGLAGVWNCRRASFSVEARYQGVFWLIALVGAGSMGFHGTLLRSMQVLDELPMVYGSLGLLYCARFRRAKPDELPEDRRSMRRWQGGLLLYSAAFTTAYFLHEATFAIFIASFAIAVTILALWGLRIAYGKDSTPTLRRLVHLSVASFAIAVGLFWLPERHLPCDHEFQHFHPHAIFHLFAMVGTYGGNLAFIYDRQRGLGREVSVCMGWPAPFVRIHPAK